MCGSFMIFRRPQNIEFPVLVLSFGCLLYIFITFDPGKIAPQALSTTTFHICLVFTTVCLIGEAFLHRAVYRIAVLFTQLIVLLATLAVLKGRYLIEELFLVSLLILQFSLRLSLIRGAVLNVIALICATLIGIKLGSDISDRIVVLLFGLFWIFLTELIMYYREKLVEKSNTIEVQRQSLENLVAANRSFVEHLEYVKVESADKERLRITRELHDAIGYAMTNISMMMSASRHLIRENPIKLLEYCGKTRELSTSTLRETRDILYKLRAVEQHTTQNPAIFFIKLCKDFDDATGVETECHVGNLPERINEGVFNVLFRAVQVGFINALRHGSAGHIRLSFWLTNDELLMRIWNDMQISAEHSVIIAKGIGFKGISERLETVSGRLRFGTVIDGFELVVAIPRKEITRGIY